MNKDNAKDYLPLVQALADGKVIQVQLNGVWKNAAEQIAFDGPPSDYRIKPEPREIWVNHYYDGDLVAFNRLEVAENHLAKGGFTKHYREVIE